MIMFFDKLMWWFAILCFSAGFFGGCQVQSFIDSAKYNDLVQTIQNNTEEARKKQLDTTQRLISVITATDKETLNAEDSIHTDYTALIDRLQYQSDTTGSGDEADNTGASSEVTATCNCRKYAESRRAYDKLQKDILTITRDCDITATRYNELLKLCLETRTLLNQ